MTTELHGASERKPTPQRTAARLMMRGLFGALAVPLLLAAFAVPVSAAPQFGRPPEPLAYARIAVARVLAYYYGKTSTSGPIPVLSPCIGDAALVGTTGANLNSFTYALVPTALVNPIDPCQDVKTAFAQFNGQAATWGLIRIQVVLNVAYTGISAQQVGSVTYNIDPGQIRTTGASTGPQLLTLPLTAANGAPGHDLPVLQIPQASDPPADPANSNLIDLLGQTAAPLNASALPPDQINATLYPWATPPTSAFPDAAQPTTTPAPLMGNDLAARYSLGAVEVDGNGRLIGMVGADSQGNHVLYGTSDLQRAIGGVTGKSGQLMSQWKQGLDAFYANPPQYGAAQSAFSALTSAYPDFGGAQPFATAASQQSGDIPPLANPAATPTTNTTPTTTSHDTIIGLILAAMAGVALLALLIGVGIFALRSRSARVREQLPPDEAMLDLLPPDMALEDVPEDEPTRPLSRIELNHALTSEGATNASAISEQATARIAVIPRAAASPRKTSVLVAQAAGMIDPGLKRRSEPNQDNIFALEGVRSIAGRLQPYSLLIVADGMGGHLNGQLASRLTIETVARSVAHPMNSSQPFNGSALSQLLEDGVKEAHAELQRRNHEQASDMGTTITAALIVDDTAYIVNVGDSRTYLLNPDTGLRQVTRDHSVVATLVASGIIRPEDIYIHPRRNQIYRSLGGNEAALEIDSFEEQLQAGDKLLLCSDGLWEMVRDPQIANVLRGAADPRQAVELLTREANANGGEDNLGVVVARMREGLPHGAQPGMHMVAGPQDAPPEGA